jgi:hypothetical protein
MKKVIVITGAKGSGKSTAIATYPKVKDIKNLLVIDTEDSMSDLASMGFTHVRMYDRFQPDQDMLTLLDAGRPPWVSDNQKKALVEYYDYLVHILNEKLQPGRFKYLGIDTIGPIEMAMSAAVESGRQVFGWGGSRAYGRFETEGMRPLYEGLLEAIARRGVETILISSHLKNPWVDDAPVMDKVKPSGRLKVLSRVSSAMFWLVPGSDMTGAPAALVLKARLGKVEPGDNGRWAVRRVLPERMPVFTWNAVERYQASPPDFANPAPGEEMSLDEQEMISELLSQKSMELMILRKREKLEANGRGVFTQSSPGPVGTPQDQAKAMIKAGNSRGEIVKATNLNMGTIIQLEGEINGK